jgi:chemotaxis protein methyltransferase CheR
LLRAALLAHAGRLELAETACRHLLRADEMSAGAHFILALCREGAADHLGATEQHRIAAYLDPTFAMPRLNLGLRARRDGDLATARRDLTEALRLLEHEEPARLLLFGGGFRREALRALCWAELQACERAA